jgi:zinc/manganese transport system permease protein
MIDILFSAFLLSVVLLGIHSYYGLHIIERGIIFTDLGIGQMAAFGAAIAILVFDGKYMYPVSLAFSLAGAFLIALSTKRTRNHEAFIGLLYAFGMSAAVIALSRAPRGAEEMQHLVAADILFVPMHAVLKTAILYAIIGAVLWLALHRLKGTWRELLFFGTFSLTVTSSVNLAGCPRRVLHPGRARVHGVEHQGLIQDEAAARLGAGNRAQPHRHRRFVLPRPSHRVHRRGSLCAQRNRLHPRAWGREVRSRKIRFFGAILNSKARRYKASRTMNFAFASTTTLPS